MRHPAPDQISLEWSPTGLNFGVEFIKEFGQGDQSLSPACQLSLNERQRKKLRCSYDVPDVSKSAWHQYSSFAVTVSQVSQR